MNPLPNKEWIPAFAGMTSNAYLGILLSALFWLIGLFPFPLQAAELPHHDLTVSLDPSQKSLTVSDTIAFPKDSRREINFALHQGLAPSSPDPAVRIIKKDVRQGSVPLEVFTVTLPENTFTVTIKYSGTIYHPLESTGVNQARGFETTAGSIADQGVYLSGSSAWYPLLESDFITFSLKIELPSGWDAVSQGTCMNHEKTKSLTRVGWDSPEPQEEIYIIASRFIDYQKVADNITDIIYLRSPEPSLANKYLDAAAQYIAMYDKLIGPYPYKKFALVENFWETGFGMPSFTLLGPTVIRLPFIINTSYPHEILHNWWGNSVYPVYEKGNWSEGITAYLADHLLKEQQGAGAEYRLNTLQKYADYVLSGRDFPLTGFTSRHSPSTEAVGYGKSLMFFHMLRLRMGDKTFTACVRDFYRDYKFHYATFDDIRKSFETASGSDLKTVFEQWITRAGAPEIRLREATMRSEGRGKKDEKAGNYIVSGRIDQVQPGEAYHLRIPVAITLEGQEQAFQTALEINTRRNRFSISVPSRPLRLDLDPEFDVFRRLDRGEIPPAISLALGAKKMLVVLPADAPDQLLRAYRAFAESLSGSGPDSIDIKLDREIAKLPKDSAVTLLGWENRFRGKTLSALKDYEVADTNENIKIGKTAIAKNNHSIVLSARNPGTDSGLMFIAADTPAALPGLARKLPHYHKYSYLAFEGDEPANIAKGRWPVVNSPLTAFLAGPDGRTSGPIGKLAPREPLASLPPAFSQERMRDTVTYLSSDKLKGREIGTRESDQAADYIAKRFKEAGLAPGGDNGTYFQTWEQKNENPPQSPFSKGGNQKFPPLTKGGTGGFLMKNVIGVIPGKKREYQGQSVVVGAHYDHLGTGMSIGRSEDRGRIHPGADDNASGVAVLLELAAVLKTNLNPDRSIVFIAFTGEEEGKLGSRHYVAGEKTYPAAQCIGMVNLDTVGRLGQKKLLVLGSGSAKEWVHIFRGAGFVTGIDIDMVSEDLDSSDQKSFQEAGVPAVQLFSGPHLDYHRPTDTADKIDAAGLVKVASVTKEVIEYLVDRKEPLTSAGRLELRGQPGPKTERKVSLGTIPDFAYSGKGLRLSGVVDGSPAASAGLKEGDVIIKVNSSPVRGLKDFSDVLKTLKPGDRISIAYVRDGKERTVETEVKER